MELREHSRNSAVTNPALKIRLICSWRRTEGYPIDALPEAILD